MQEPTIKIKGKACVAKNKKGVKLSRSGTVHIDGGSERK